MLNQKNNSGPHEWVTPTSVTKIRLEATTVCQLRCPSCPTAAGIIAREIGNGYLKLEDFKQYVLKNPWLKKVELSNWGEIFLNPDLLEIMEFSADHGVKLAANNGANLNNVRPEVLEGLVKYGFKSINCSIDGATQETYEKYRVKGNYDKVIANIKKINQYKLEYESPFPELVWQFVIFGHNEHEIPLVKRLADELGMKVFFKLSWDDDFSPPKDFEFIHHHTGLAAPSRKLFKKRTGESYAGGKRFCRQLWEPIQINFDGKILGCCVNRWGDFGYVKEGNLKAALNNEKIRYARLMVTGKAKPREDVPCSTCPKFSELKKSNSWLTGDDIPPNVSSYPSKY